MSLKEQDRESLVVLGLEKSYKMLDEMSWLAEKGSWSLAANRLYYALFHAVRALLISDAHPVGTHRGAVIQFNLYYIKTGLFDTHLFFINLQISVSVRTYRNMELSF